ncbi:uncharacterized protein LOC133905905 isoform X2 [Phragmites australis]|uniref:uncharacterized protein LOC133905905 isoform X2 n=1 Tax=Phragmites australis TaxID=29695 RepID=UPI002D79107A|nr:uncharacterized protein LOC133905905 isoform X2 [Phragmites australis]
MSSAEIAPSNSYDCKNLDAHISEELWYACAGPGVAIPQVEELVVYFPQGHLEQTGGVPKHLQDVPSQIICRVLNIELKSEEEFVYASLVLQPELIHDFEVIENKGLPPAMPRHPVPYFCKKLRVVDTMAHAWLSIPRKHAEKCLPPLDMTQIAPMQELVAKDFSGMGWRFQHRLVGPRRHLLQTADFATSKNFVVGDALVILRGADGVLRVGVRRSMRQLRNVSSSEIPSTQGLSILPSISHAATTRSKFTVLYRPRAGTDQFVVSYNRYVESIKGCYMGMRFRMIFSREAATEDRVSGTISGIEDFDAAWPCSKWRCLKVKWDKKSPIENLNSVSPWEIEPEKRSSVRILPDFVTKRTRGQRGLRREDPKQKAAVLLSHDSPYVDMEACLNNAKKVLQLYHDDSMMQESSSIVENRIYLSAVDDLMYLSRGPSSGFSAAADSVRMQAQAALDIEMSNLARTLCGLKLWNTNHFEDLDSPPHHPSTVSNLNSPLALDGPCLSSTSSEPVSLSSNSTGASSIDSDLIPAEDCSPLHNVMSCLEENKLDLINLTLVNVVASIARLMIKAGYKERLRETFTDLSRDLIRDFYVLDFNWIFRCRSWVDEGDSRHCGDMSLQYWNSASQFITRMLVEMRRQLNEQNFGAFDELKGDYFAKIVEQPVLKLLNVASMSAALNNLLEEVPPGLVECLSSIFLRIIHALSTHKTITDVVPTLLELVSPECRESVSTEAEAIRERVEDVVRRMLDTATNVISSLVLPETEGSGIHPVTRAVAKGIGSLFQHRDTLNLILAHNCCQTLQGIHTTKSFNFLISNLMMHLESVLEQNSKLLVQRESQYIFLLNNLQFLLQRVESSMTNEATGYDWVVRYQEQIEHSLEEYIETSWAPVSSHLAEKAGKHLSFWKPSCVQQFITAFQSVYDIQRHWKVPDPHLRQKLRVSISKKIVPSYCDYLKKHQKDDRCLRLTAKDLEDMVEELFEG